MFYLFDLDGTLFDTKLANAMAYKIAINKLGYNWKLDDYYNAEGKCVENFAPKGIDLNELKRLKAIYYKQNFDLVEPNKNILDIYNNVKNKAIVTTARKENALALLSHFNVKVDNIICQEDVVNKKPSPDCYLLAKEKFGKNNEFLAFEDSIEGISSARRAGIKVLKVNKSEQGIADLSGGSHAKTYLMFENEKIFIKKVVSLEFADGLKSQAKWYKNQGLLLSEATEHNLYQICIEYIDGIMFDEFVNKHLYLEKIINKIEELHKPGYYICKDIEKFVQKHFYDCIETWNVNKIQETKEIIDKIDFSKFEKIKCDGQCHGDCTFTNIIMSGDNRRVNPVLIDPALDNNFFECVYFDVAKFGHSVYGYEKIVKGQKFDNYDYFLRKKYNEILNKRYSEDEIYCIKFFIASFYFRRLKYQVIQDKTKCQRLFNEGMNMLKELIR